MSYDIHLEINCGVPEHNAVVWDDWNYTSNCAPMWRAAGADLAEFDGHTAQECTAVLEMAVGELKANPEKYKKMDSPNGWGKYENLVPRLDVLLDAFRLYPKATVCVNH